MSTEKWEVRKIEGYWSVIAPNDDAAADFPWHGLRQEAAGGRWTFPFHYGPNPHATATRVLRAHLDGRRT